MNGPLETKENVEKCPADFDETLNEHDVETVRGGNPGSVGFYVEGQVENLKVTFTVDTGATRTLISDKMYNKLDERSRPELRPVKVNLLNACGSKMKVLGEAQFKVNLGDTQIMHRIIVAGISDEGLLGMDIMQDGPWGPIDILLSRGALRLGRRDVKGHQVGMPPKLMKVKAVEELQVPALSEVVIDVSVEDSHILTGENKLICIEASENFEHKNTIAVARTMVEVGQPSTLKARVMNPFKTPTTIHKGEIIGQAEEVEIVDTIALEEDEKLVDELSKIRRIAVGHIEEIQDDDITNSHAREVKELKNEDIPEHVRDLYNRSIGGGLKKKQS